WGFCLSQKQFNCLKADTYDILIDSTLGDGKLTYGELLIKGESEQEILFSSYICHPSLANDNLSGPVLLVYLAQELQKMKLKYSYRFLFVPETIGAITWLEKNEKALPKIKGGLVVTCVGDRGKMMYQRSRDGNALIDRAVEKVLMDANKKFEAFDYAPTGSDERQFSSPGFNLQMGSLMRTMYGQFPEYHTSADNLDLIDEKSFADSLNKYLDVVFILENDGTFKNQNPKCEPQLGKRGLYSAIGSQKNQGVIESAIIWVLNQSDGSNSLLDIAINSKISFKDIKIASDALIDKGLLKRVEKSDKRNRCASH
ncbi:MAG: DUF4910 domain-containing protein, partial [Candidatus Berkelbacteria bacterium]|nr:DUF4910 domain-containing protein [Candidatus Berkelbacteria bacterium]